MKKNTKKQIPKVRLPKYKPGGLYENESGNAHEDAHSGSDNIYNEGRSNKLSNDQYGQMAQAGIQGGMQAYQTSQTPGLSKYEKNQQYGKSIENTEQGVVSAINPVFGMIHSGVGMIMNPLTAKATATDAEGNLVNRKQAKNQAIGRAFADPLAMLPTLISTGWNRDKYADQIESDAKGKIAAQKAQEDAYNQQQVDAQNQQNAYIQNAVQQGIAANNNQNKGMGVQYAKFGGLMKYGMGGMQYANGGTGQINAEVEGGGYGQDGENAVAPGGQFTQFNGPTHAQGGIQTDMAPGTRIFSDKIKIGNKTVAELNKPNNTNREDKLAAKGNLDPKTATSLALTKMAKMKNSDMLFNMQEQIKKDKVAAYAKKMGVQLPSMDNEQAEPQGMSEQSEGEMPINKYGGMYAKGGIHINPANKGKFTASAQHAGMGTQEFARHVLANKEDYSSTQVKRANFAHNAAGWKHEMGGMQEYEMGGESEYNMLGNPDEPRPLNQKNAKVKAAIARNLNENPLVKDYNYRLQVDNKKGDRLFATGTDGKENEVFFQDLKTGKYNPAYNDTVRAAIKIKMEQDALNSVQKHALGGVQLPYYNTNNDGTPKYSMGGFNNDTLFNNAGDPPTKITGGYANKPDGPNDIRYYWVNNKQVIKPEVSSWEKKGLGTGMTIDQSNQINKARGAVWNKRMEGTPQNLPKFEYLNDPSKGSYDQQFNEYKKVYLPGFKYGGNMPKYYWGGVDGKTWIDDNQPTAGFQSDAWQQSSGPVNNVGENSNINNLITNEDYNKFRQHSLKMTNSQIVGPTDEERNIGKITDKDNISLANAGRKQAANKMSGESQYLPDNNNVRNNPINASIAKGVQREPSPNNFDWQNAISQGANFLGQNAGNIYDLTRKNEPLETYERAKANYLNDTAAMRDAEQEARRAEVGIKNASAGNAGTYLANRIGLNTSNIMNKDRIRQAYANANAEIGNKNAQFNAEIARSEAIARAANAAAKQNVNSQAIHSIGSNFGKMTKSNKEDAMDQNELAMFQWRYQNEPGFRDHVNKFSTKKSKTTKG